MRYPKRVESAVRVLPRQKDKGNCEDIARRADDPGVTQAVLSVDETIKALQRLEIN